MVFRAMLPMVIVQLIGVLAITFVPRFTAALPRWSGHRRSVNMSSRMLASVLAGSLMPLVGCASALDMRSEPLDRGVSRVFTGDYDRVVKAAHESVVDAGLKINEESLDIDHISTIVATKPLSMFSYGEVVRLVVVQE